MGSLGVTVAGTSSPDRKRNINHVAGQVPAFFVCSKSEAKSLFDFWKKSEMSLFDFSGNFQKHQSWQEKFSARPKRIARQRSHSLDCPALCQPGSELSGERYSATKE